MANFSAMRILGLFCFNGLRLFGGTKGLTPNSGLIGLCGYSFRLIREIFADLEVAFSRSS